MVASLQRGGDLPLAESFSRLPDQSSQSVIVLFVQAHSTDGIPAIRVKAGGDQNQLRREFPCPPLQRGFQPGLQGTSIRSGGEGDVPGESQSPSSPPFLFTARARIKGVLMGGEEVRVGILVEALLGSVAVVDIEIDDPDPLEAEFLLKMARPNGHVVEDAESHSP